MSDDITLPGMTITLEFYFVCPDGHVHTAAIQATSMKRATTNAELLNLQRKFLAGPMAGMRVATESEVDQFRMAKSYLGAEPDAGYVMVPGKVEAQ